MKLKKRSKTAKDIVAIDLFSGPGGLSHGFSNAGFKIVAAVECDAFAAMTFKKSFPETELLMKKIENLDPEKLLSILAKKAYQKVVLIGGPPCQPFSSANRQSNGNDNPLASTIEHFVNIAKEIKPDAFLFENVISFKCVDGGKSIDIFKKRLEELGFQISVRAIDLNNLGVPQHRRRLFIGGMQKNNQKNFNLTPMSNAKQVTVRESISDLPMLNDGGGGKDEMNYPRKKKSLSDYQKELRGGEKLYNHWCSKNSEEVIETMKCIKQNSSLKKSWSCLPERIRARYSNFKALHNNIYKRLSWEEPSPTIVHARRAMLLHPIVNRIITVREAARIQSFPDKIRFYGGIHSQYQQVANSVPPKAAEALANVYFTFLC